MKEAIFADFHPRQGVEVPLEVIGAGLGRTGTHSLKLALDELGFGPCHHMSEVMTNPTQRDRWRAKARGEAIDWEALYEGYRSAVDWPTAHYWRELSEVYPDAKLILTVRDPDQWHRSVTKTIAETMVGGDPDSFGVRVIFNEVFGGRIMDRDHAVAVYEAHNAAVKAAIPPERLLVYEVAQGWGPLCSHLGVPVPEAPFPLSNTTDEFRARMAAVRAEAGNRQS
jgi:hypothetical protein